MEVEQGGGAWAVGWYDILSGHKGRLCGLTAEVKLRV